MARVESERSSHAGSASDGPDGWGSRGREYLARRAAAGTPAGRAYAAHLESLAPDKAAVELRAMFALSATEDLAADIASDLRLAPSKAKLIAEQIAAARQRLERATSVPRRAAPEG